MRAVVMILLIVLANVQCTKSSPVGAENSNIQGISLVPRRVPMFMGKNDQPLYDLKISCVSQDPVKISLEKITIQFTDKSQTNGLASLSLLGKDWQNPLFGSVTRVGNPAEMTGHSVIAAGNNFFTLSFTPKTEASLDQGFEIQEIMLWFSDKSTLKVSPESKFTNRPAIILRAAGQDQVNTYRIPGLVNTNNGTLVAVYDNRYLASGDLQGDIDVGMSRSTDGGQTWEPMKRVIDMGMYNGLPQNQNGVGDPAVLVDKNTNTIWVAGLWVSGIPGQSAWNGSKPGMKPGETGQIVLVRSDDDGVTWSPPVNITEQCKNPAWHLFFQGPGKGITLSDGTLVFPAQYKDDQKVPWSTIIYSKDHGKTWTVGTGAKSNTTESQVVQLPDGSLMLNMRDDRNRTEKGDQNGRAVSISRDLGLTWTTHSSSNAALPESNCMASLISARVKVNGVEKEVLFFSNPNDKTSRAHMTIKVSLDLGATWPVACQTELNSDDSYGYSCLTMVGEKTLGILYEGTKDLYFQKISVEDLLGTLSK